jgi:hypothetical protein
MKYGRRPQFLGKWKTTLIFLKMEDDLNIFENGRRPILLFFKWKTTYIYSNGRQPQVSSNGRQPQVFQMEDNLKQLNVT